MTDNDIARIDGSIAAYTNVLCRDCHQIMEAVDTNVRKCPECGVTAEVQTSVEMIDRE